MDTAAYDLVCMLAKRKEYIQKLNTEILEEWNNNGPATIELINGTKIVRSTIKSVEVLKRKETLEILMSLIKEDEKLPFKVKWEDKGIIPLIDTNVIPAEFATIGITFRLAVRKQKD